MVVELRSCFCLFDTCLLSFEANDPFQTLIRRVSVFFQGEYKREKLLGLCGCRLCRPARYSDNSYWNLRLYSNTTEWRYVCCRDYTYRCLNNAELFQKDYMILNTTCLNTYILSRYSGEQKFPSCYFYWDSNLITLNDFCNPCKMYFLRSQHFKLQIISKDNNDIFSTSTVRESGT